MTITLPTSPGYAEATPMFIDAGATIPSPLGGATQRCNRMGSRFGLQVVMPPMPHAIDAMAWISALNQGLLEGVATRWPTVGFDTSALGAGMNVNGAGQTGTSLAVSGGPAGYAYKAGQHFSVSGYNYEIRTNGTLNGAGVGSLPVLPELRASPANAANCAFSPSMIEGFLEGDGREWTIDRARMVGLSFTVIERR